MKFPRLSDVSVPTPPRPSPRAVVTLAAGREALELLEISGARMANYAERVGAERVVMSPPASVFPLAYKFALPKFLEVYERVLFLDADVMLSRDCPDLFDEVPPGRLGLHDDYPELPNRGWCEGEYRNLCLSQGWTTTDPQTCYNTGVMVVSRGHEPAFERPTRPFPITHTAEQSLINLNIARHKIPVARLPWAYNWQWWADPEMRRMAGCKVFHFASASHENRMKFMSRL